MLRNRGRWKALTCLTTGPQKRGQETGQSPKNKFQGTADLFLGQQCYQGGPIWQTERGGRILGWGALGIQVTSDQYRDSKWSTWFKAQLPFNNWGGA